MNRVLVLISFTIMYLVGAAISNSTPVIVIDPGHGGPGASFTDNGGGFNQNRGSNGPVYELAEQWVNLSVALELRDLLGSGNCFLTRDTDTADVSYRRRAELSDSGEVFLSIHHNGLPLGAQGTEMRWCGASLNSDSMPRPDDVADSTFAKKALYRLLDWTGYTDRCYTASNGSPIQIGCQDCDGDPWLIRNVRTEHVLTEASNLNDTTEENNFLSSSYREDEAETLSLAYMSWYWGQGFGRIEYYYIDDNPMTYDPCSVMVNFHWYGLPYERCWLTDEMYTLEAFDVFEADGYQYQFDRWGRVDYTTREIIQLYDPGENPIYPYAGVDQDGYHFLVAYYTGGPFKDCLAFLDSDFLATEMRWYDTVMIKWSAPVGHNATCSLLIDLSTNNGSTWEPIVGPIAHNFPYDEPINRDAMGYYYWGIPEITAANCFVRIIAYDDAFNVDTLISHQFSIECYLPVAAFSADPDSGDAPLTVQFLDETTHEPSSWLWGFGDGTTSGSPNPQHTYDSVGLYTVSLTCTNQCGTGDTVMMGLIDVTCVVQPDFVVGEPDPIYTPKTVNFLYDSLPVAPSGHYIWEFGDGGDTIGQDLFTVRHRYDCVGTYTVSLSVTTECGEGSITKPDFIHMLDSTGNMDYDGDGWGDECDICPYEWNPSQDYAGLEWQKQFPEEDGFTNLFGVQPTTEGRYLCIGRPNETPGCCYSLWLLDPCGGVIWHRACGGVAYICDLKGGAGSAAAADDQRGYRGDWPLMEKTSDSGFIVVTNAWSNMTLMKLRADGFNPWSRHLGDPYDLAYSVNQSPYGGFVVGAISDSPYMGVKIIKTDQSGHTQWTDVIEELWPVGAYFVDLKPTSDGGYVYASHIYDTTTWDDNVVVAKLDANRNIDWRVTWDAGGDDYATKVIETPDGGFVVGGWTRLPEEKFFLIKFDASGTLLWERFYTVTNHARCYDMRPTSDGGFLMVGTGVDSVEYERQFYVVKTDENGLLQWQQMFDGNDGDFAHTCAETFDGGYIIGGAAPDGSNVVGMVVKMMPPEVTSCCVGIRGNVDGDPGDNIDISDLVMLADYMFTGGAEPPCWSEANVDGIGPDDAGGIDISDFVYLADYMFSSGPEPAVCP